jgi:DNA-directed RNA polymerase specialized sigma subunit
MPRPKRKVPIDRYVARSLKEIAKELGCTPMRVFQIERCALRKIKAELLSRRVVTARGQFDVR